MQLLTIDGETIVTTPNHPFYTGTGEWVPAGELQVGNTVRNGQWGTGLIEAISFVYAPQPMYNLTVATAHTYFVGDGQWLVHNCNNWLGYGTPPKWGLELAQEVDRFYSTLPRWIRNSSTVAIGKVGETRYITAKGPALDKLRELNDSLKLGNYIFVDNLTLDHAEVRLYKYLNGNVDGIAVSHRKGPCGPDNRDCRGFFENLGFENIFWTGESK